MLIEAIFWGFLGLILGSFANVLIARHGVKPPTGRSACPHCGRTLTWYELIPVLSWAALKGKCATCTKRISLQYPIVELSTALLCIAIGLSLVPLALKSTYISIGVLLVAIIVYDLKHTVIPDQWSYSVGALSLVAGFLSFSFSNLFDLAVYLCAGPLVAAPLFALWLFSRGAWMGLGDVKLVLGFGWLVGVTGAYVALGLAFVLGAFVGVFFLLPLKWAVHKLEKSGITRYAAPEEGFTMKSEVPFGPFLILGLCIVWIPALYDLDFPGILLHFLSLS